MLAHPPQDEEGRMLAHPPQDEGGRMLTHPPQDEGGRMLAHPPQDRGMWGGSVIVIASGAKQSILTESAWIAASLRSSQ
jgi:hypothetical protein